MAGDRVISSLPFMLSNILLSRLPPHMGFSECEIQHDRSIRQTYKLEEPD